MIFRKKPIRQVGLLCVLFLFLGLIYQNCGQGLTIDTERLQNLPLYLAPATTTTPATTQPPPPINGSCIFDGKSVADKNTIPAYESSTVPNGSQCKSEIRTCTQGVLSGTYKYSICTVGGPSACLFHGTTIEHGQEVTAYQTSTVATDQTCVNEKRKCDNGNLSGNYTFATCEPLASNINSLELVAGSLDGAGNHNGSSSEARFHAPKALTIDSAGNLYVTEALRYNVRKITTNGTVTSLAGDPFERGSTNGKGPAARFGIPNHLAADSNKNVYVTDSLNYIIRKIAEDGAVTTLAGSGQSKSTDGKGTAAEFKWPFGITTDSRGDIYVTDYQDYIIRKITADGTVSLFAGSAGQRGSTDGVGSNAKFDEPKGLSFDPSGNLYVADANNYAIRKIDTNGTVSTFLKRTADSNSYSVKSLTYVQGNLYFTAMWSSNIFKMATSDKVEVFVDISDYGKPTFGSEFRHADGNNEDIVADAAGNLFVVDSANNTIRKVTSNGIVSTFAGAPSFIGDNDGIGAEARFRDPSGICVDSKGNLYVADKRNHTIRKIDTQNNVTTLAGKAKTHGSDDGVGSAAKFFNPEGIAIDSTGNIYVTDTENHTIRKIDTQNNVTTLAGKVEKPGFQDDNSDSDHQALFHNPLGIAIGPNGDLFIADSGNHAIRKIDVHGKTTTLVRGLIGNVEIKNPIGVAVDSVGNIFMTSYATSQILKVLPDKSITIFASKESGLSNSPAGIAMDSSNNIYVTDFTNHIIQKISPAGVVSSLAGNPRLYGLRLGPLPTTLFMPYGIAVTSSGKVYFTDKNAVLKF